MSDGQRIVLATLLLALTGPVVGTVFGRSKLRTYGSLAVALVAQSIPFLLAPEHRFLRSAYSLGAFVSLLRWVDVWRDARTWTWPQRLWLFTALFDTRKVRSITPEISLSRFGAAVFYALLMGSGLWLAYALPAKGVGLVVRWFGGALFVYSMLDMGGALMDGTYRTLGIQVPPLHRAPILSASVSEFWSKRWNLNVHEWIREHVYAPLAGLGRPLLGLTAGFFASALLHAWLVYVPLGAVWALPMAAFFMLQAIFIGLERRLGVRRWGRAARHVWTVAAVLGPSPLFVEPFLQIVHAS